MNCKLCGGEIPAIRSFCDACVRKEAEKHVDPTPPCPGCGAAMWKMEIPPTADGKNFVWMCRAAGCSHGYVSDPRFSFSGSLLPADRFRANLRYEYIGDKEENKEQEIPMKAKVREAARQGVELFVVGLNGRYREHVPDRFLIELIMYRMDSGSPHRKECPHTVAELTFLDRDPNEAYIAVCFIFERILEHGCRAGGNGHHVAQSFQAHMDKCAAAADLHRLEDDRG